MEKVKAGACLSFPSQDIQLLMTSEEQTSDMTTGLRAVECCDRVASPMAFTGFPPFHLLNFYLKVAWDFLNKCLTGTNQLAQLNTQVKYFIFTYPAHLNAIRKPRQHADWVFRKHNFLHLVFCLRASPGWWDWHSLVLCDNLCLCSRRWVSLSKQSINIGNKWWLCCKSSIRKTKTRAMHWTT